MNPSGKPPGAPSTCGPTSLHRFTAKLLNAIVSRPLGSSVFAPRKPFLWVPLDSLSLLSQLYPRVFYPGVPVLLR